MAGNPTTHERSVRSVFVGNIPYDASEEKLKDIFSEAGPVLSFKLVFDRESGKPKGYGFCEYRDQETAHSAMRNLNGYDLNGRQLRVDTATNERFKEEMKNLQISLTGNTFESPYGPEVDPEKAPEHIAKVVASLPPEQMFELARQMKHCALTNPNEARNMLVQNPQLAYALLQLLVVMKGVDINAASSILYKPNPAPINIPPGNIGPVPITPGQPVMPHGVIHSQPPPQQIFDHPMDPHFRGGPPPPHQNFDQRHIDPRLRQQPDPRQSGAEMYDPRLGPPAAPAAAPLDPRLRGQGQPIVDPRHMPQAQQQQQQQQQNVPPPGIRGPTPAAVVNAPPATAGPQAVPFANRFGPPPAVVPTAATVVSPQVPGIAGQPEEEKTQLIMQVLALSDQQIALLPPDQRNSIIQLKEQLARGGQP